MTARDGRRLVVTPASSIRMRMPTWTHTGRIPAGALTLLAGREGIGKSTVAFDLVARITTGKLEGVHFGTPKAVVIVAGEDDWSCVIVPRLVAAGADLEMVAKVEARVGEEHESVSLPVDVAELAEMCLRNDVALIVLDPLMSTIHGSLDTHKDRDVRQALEPLSRLAEESGAAVLGLIHVNKSAADDPLNAIMGSRAFAAVARSVLFCMVDRDAEEDAGEVYLFGHAKCNLGPKMPTLRYHISTAEVAIEAAETGYAFSAPSAMAKTSRIVWDGEDGRSISEAWATPPPERAKGEVRVKLLMWIMQQGRTVSSAEVLGHFHEIPMATIKKTLSRMVQSGELTRPLHGHYASPSSGQGQGDSQSDTSPGDNLRVTTVTTVTLQDQGDGSDSGDAVTGTGDGVTFAEPFAPVAGGCTVCGHPLWSPTSKQTGLCAQHLSNYHN